LQSLTSNEIKRCLTADPPIPARVRFAKDETGQSYFPSFISSCHAAGQNGSEVGNAKRKN